MCCVSEVAACILPLTFFFILYPCTIAPLHTLLFILLADPEIAHQWSGKPIFLREFHIPAPNEAKKVGSETTDKYT